MRVIAGNDNERLLGIDQFQSRIYRLREARCFQESLSCMTSMMRIVYKSSFHLKIDSFMKIINILIPFFNWSYQIFP